MTATIKTDLVGVRQAVASLNKIEPGLRKQFALELNQIAAAGNTTRHSGAIQRLGNAVVWYGATNGQRRAVRGLTIPYVDPRQSR
jgi:hypothetical protein